MVRLASVLLVGLAGCAQLLGFEDPGNSGDDAGNDATDCAPVPVFGNPTRYPTGFLPISWAVGDLDHDALPDLAITGNGSIIIWHGNGDGTLGREQSVSIPAPCTGGMQVAAEDVDGDGFDDLTVFAVNSCTAVYLLRQDPTNPGMFLPGTLVLDNVDPMAPFSIGDLDGNGLRDIALTDSSGVARAYQVTGSPGMFEVQPRITLSSPPPDGKTPLIDLDEDGRLDIPLLLGTRTNVLYQDATDGDFRAPVAIGPNDAAGIAAGLINGDATEDLLISTDTGTQIYEQVDGSPGTFEAGPTIALARTARLSLVDLDGDGRLDVLTRLPDASYLLQCAAPQAAGTYSTTVRPLDLPTIDGDLLDVDGDGYIDLIRAVDGDAVEVSLQLPPPS